MGRKPEETEAQKYVNNSKARQASAAAQPSHHLLCGPKGTQSALQHEESWQPHSLSPPLTNRGLVYLALLVSQLRQ